MPVTARVCVILPGAWFLSSSLVKSSYGRNRLPCPCSLMLRKQNTCVLSSVFCSLCRNSLLCKQVLRVTNTYVLSFDFNPSWSKVLFYILKRFWLYPLSNLFLYSLDGVPRFLSYAGKMFISSQGHKLRNGFDIVSV